MSRCLGDAWRSLAYIADHLPNFWRYGGAAKMCASRKYRVNTRTSALSRVSPHAARFLMTKDNHSYFTPGINAAEAYFRR